MSIINNTTTTSTNTNTSPFISPYHYQTGSIGTGYYSINESLNHLKYVVAGSFDEYINWLEFKGYCYTEYVYVIGPKQISGLSKINGCYVGSWRNREDINEIKLIIEETKKRNERVEYDTITFQNENLANVQSWEQLFKTDDIFSSDLKIQIQSIPESVDK